MEEIIKKIEDASVYIPEDWAIHSKVTSGEAYAYVQGIMAGRKQAVDILKEHHE